MPRTNRGTHRKEGKRLSRCHMGERKTGGKRREKNEGADAQEAHLYAFPLITGRGQWLPLHNGFASASHLLPSSLGGGGVEGRGGVDRQAPKKCWLANQTWPCGHTHT